MAQAMIQCTFEHGKTAFLRHVTVDAIVVRENRVLLVQRAKTSLVEPGRHVFPGGYLERDERGVEAIEREMLEETGYQVEKVSLFRIVDSPRVDGDDRQNVGFFYEVSVGDQIQLPDNEVELVSWFDIHALPEIGFDHLEQLHLYLKTYRERIGWPIV